MTTLLDEIKRERRSANQADLTSLNERIRATQTLLTTLRRRRAELELAERLERGVMTVSEAMEHLEPIPDDVRDPDFSERVFAERWAGLK